MSGQKNQSSELLSLFSTSKPHRSHHLVNIQQTEHQQTIINVQLGPRVQLGHHIHLENCQLERGVIIGHYVKVESGVHLGESVQIGHHCHLKSGVHIAAGAIIQDHSVVEQSVPAGEVWGGAPAKAITQNINLAS